MARSSCTTIWPIRPSDADGFADVRRLYATPGLKAEDVPKFFKDGSYAYEGEGKTRSKEEQAKYLAELTSRSSSSGDSSGDSR